MAEDKNVTQKHVPKIIVPIGTPLGNTFASFKAGANVRTATGEHRPVKFRRWEWIAIAVAPIVVTAGIIVLYLIATQ